jgi:histidinol-phosphate aminotransferase
MTPTRRAFVRSIGLGGLAAVSGATLSARGSEASWNLGAYGAMPDPASSLLRLDSNENPVGPSPAALDAVRASFVELGRYPYGPARELPGAIAAELGVPRENVLTGCGSGEILRLAVQAYTSPTRALVTASPTFESPAHMARVLGHPLHEVPVDAALRLDLAAMEARAVGAGLVFLCNPNNPTGTAYPARTVADFIARLAKASPDTHVLVDEAYHDYAGEDGYGSVMALALEQPRLVVSRTFSKAYGMAGLRVGFAVGQRDTIDRMARWKLPNGVNLAAAHAAAAAIADGAFLARERRRHAEALAFTRRGLEAAGLAVPESHANFVFVDIERDIDEFRAACRERGVAIGRPFPPLMSHARISIGTLDEMRQAMDVFRRVLGVTSSAAVR